LFFLNYFYLIKKKKKKKRKKKRVLQHAPYLQVTATRFIARFGPKLLGEILAGV
jgi:hypothetical protein